jgi:hypothetical protein
VDTWREVEREAREQMLVALEADENTQLVFGNHIAWVDCRFGLTDSLSSVHRVGFPEGRAAVTTCGELIPAPKLRMSLTPGLIRSLGRCRYCEAEYQRAVRENAA